MTSEFIHVGVHEEDLEGGRIVSPGQIIELSDEEQEQPHNKRLIDEGVLAPVEKSKSSSQKTRKDGED